LIGDDVPLLAPFGENPGGSNQALTGKFGLPGHENATFGNDHDPETVATKGKQAFYANPGFSVTSSSVVITAINTKPGDVIYWHQAFGTKPWPKQVVATG
jgi:hypothetical protein